MQLFITTRKVRGNVCRLEEERVCKQMRTVLRMKEGDTFQVQERYMRTK